MTTAEILTRYVEICTSRLPTHKRALRVLERNGVTKAFVRESLQIGFSDGTVTEFADDNEELQRALERIGLIENGRDRFRNCIIIPILDETKTPVNLVGYSIYPQRKPRTIWLNEKGILNGSFLKHTDEVLLTREPLEALALIEREIANVTFLFGDEGKYEHAVKVNTIRRVTFLFDGHARLFHRLAASGVSARRAVINIAEIIEQRLEKTEILNQIENAASDGPDTSEDTITEIENGFLFRFSHAREVKKLIRFRKYGFFTTRTSLKHDSRREIVTVSRTIQRNCADIQTIILSSYTRNSILQGSLYSVSFPDVPPGPSTAPVLCFGVLARKDTVRGR